MPKPKIEKSSNWFTRYIAYLMEYFERCIGVNDFEKRYGREVKDAKQRAANKPSKSSDGGYESAAKWER